MSLSARATDRIFTRLSATYGSDFLRHYVGADANTVRSLWAHELDGFGEDLLSIAWALEHLPERPPNVIQFRALCRQAPKQQPPQLEGPPADPERVAAELAKLAPLLQPTRERLQQKARRDPRAWAAELIARHESGEHRATPTTLAMARRALRPDWT